MAALVAVGVLTIAGTPVSAPAAVASTSGPVAAPGDNIVLQWNDTLLQAVRGGSLGPPMVARAMAIVHTCIYDAWSAYDPLAVGTRFGGQLRRPPVERTVANKVEAISYAAHRAAVDLYPGSKALFDSKMVALGFDPNLNPPDTTSPAGVGVTACAAVLAFRHGDASNQLGDLNPGPYSDYTGYQPVNDPMVVAAPIDPATVHDPNRWQPLVHPNTAGQTITQTYLGPHWGRVIPFGLTSGSELRSLTPPAAYGTAKYTNQARDLITISANLTDRQKAIAEYWADGPNSETPPGHWNLFAQHVSRRDGNSLDKDAKLFFAMNNALMDAGIAAWDDKRAFDYVRPITAIRYLFDGQQITAWGGPGRGTEVIDGGTWLPYQPTTFPTPPFAEYLSGHSTFSASAAEVLKLSTGSDTFGASATIRAGSSGVEPGITPASDVTLSWSTFSAAANEAGISRRYGGIHFAQGDLDARSLGRTVGLRAWTRATLLFLGLG